MNNDGTYVTTQRTFKRYKKARLMALACFVASIGLMAWAGASAQHHADPDATAITAMVVSPLAFMAAIGLWLWAKAGEWWNNK
jgi:hypothetical protein